MVLQNAVSLVLLSLTLLPSCMGFTIARAPIDSGNESLRANISREQYPYWPYPVHDYDPVPPFRCGSSDPSEREKHNTELVAEMEKLLPQLRPAPPREPIEIPMYFHVVTFQEVLGAGTLSLLKQRDLLNAVYERHGIRFKLKAIKRRTSHDLALGSEELLMKRKLRKGNYRTLNVYFVPEPIYEGRRSLGYCHPPDLLVKRGSAPYILDGCVIHNSTVPDGDMPGFSSGNTLVHEIGHWLGLGHVSQGGCDVNGAADRDAQTSNNLTAPMKCHHPPGKNCLPEGGGSGYNYMNNIEDECYKSFSNKQVDIMHGTWKWIRGSAIEKK